MKSPMTATIALNHDAPAEVMVGFCNGLAIVIGMAQLHPFHDEERAPSNARSIE